MEKLSTGVLLKTFDFKLLHKTHVIEDLNSVFIRYSFIA